MDKAADIGFCISQAKKQAGVHCCAYACNNKPIRKLGGLCYTHYQRKRRAIDPVGVRYNQWKQKAKQRKKPFNIPLAWFRQFCKETGYILQKGKRGKNATVDRVWNPDGYTVDNIQLLTNMQNIRKYHDVDKLLTEENNQELPF